VCAHVQRMFLEAPEMRSRRHITILPVLLILSVFAARTKAQDEQWLQYRSSNEASQIIGNMRSLSPTPSLAKPEGVTVPDFASDQPMFQRWQTPMAESGGLWMAFDRTTKHGLHDRLYIDSDGDGDLSDESPYEPYRRDTYRSYFGPVKVLFEGEDGPLTYHLNVEFYASRAWLRCYIRPAAWYEGPVVINGQKKHCVLIDYNVNGAFNDKSANSSECDRIRIGKEDERDTRHVGNYIEVDDKLYRTEIAQDGAFVVLTKADDVVYGTVRLADNITSFAAGGVNGLFVRQPEDGTAKLPVGKYRIDYWNIVKKDDKGSRWELRGSSFSAAEGDFTVSQDEETELEIGEPIYSRATVRKRGSYYSFGQELEGKHAERIELTRSGSRPRPPKLRIRNKDGTYDRAMSFEYG